MEPATNQTEDSLAMATVLPIVREHIVSTPDNTESCC
jgi:hypothetical protein